MAGEYQGHERRREIYVKQESLLDKWLTPTALTLVLGGIVWGVQLNFAVAALSKQVGEAKNEATRAEVRVDRLAENTLKATVILERIERRLDRVEENHAKMGLSTPQQ